MSKFQEQITIIGFIMMCLFGMQQCHYEHLVDIECVKKTGKPCY